MARSEYPKECPVFFCTNPFYRNIVVEGVGWSNDGFSDHNDVWFRLLDGSKSYNGDDFDGVHPRYMKPLTPAAEAMLEAAKAAGK